MNDYVELRKAIDITLRKLWLLILVALLAASIGYEASRWQIPVYEATTTIMVGQFIQATEISRTDLLTNEVLAQTYADMALRRPVLQGVVDTLDLPDTWRGLKTQVRAKRVEGTQLIQITAEAGSTELAQAIADEVARQLTLLSPKALQNPRKSQASEFVSEQVTNLQKKIELGRARLQELQADSVKAFELQSVEQIQQSQIAIDTLAALISNWESDYTQMLIYLENENRSNSLTIIESAQASSDPVRPRTDLNTALAGAVGFLLALGLVLFLGLRDDRLKSTDDISLLLGITALGAINNINGKHDQDKLLLAHDPASPVTEAYRIIRSNIEFQTADQLMKIIVVTSPGSNEGKSITVANLGIIMAQAGYRTIIVDADLRQPAQHRLFQIANSRGLTETLHSPEPDLVSLHNVLSPYVKLEETIGLPELDLSGQVIDTKVRNLQVLTSGKVPLNPAELLGSQGMRKVLASLSRIADVVICDSPPVVGLTDANILANRADGVVLVIQAGQTHLAAARQAISNLQQANANLIGVIVNQGRLEDGKYYTSIKKLDTSSLVTRQPIPSRTVGSSS